MAAPVTDPEGVRAVAAAVAGSPLAAFDLEFLSQDRLVPTLCLVQVAWLRHTSLDALDDAAVAASVEVALIDPLAVDVGPLVAALVAHPCVIAHAPRQDLTLLFARFGLALPGVLDTQIMAAFAGLGDQVGFATLARELLAITIDKDLQWTDWAARPLSDAQLAYADADVRHLPPIYVRLIRKLGDRIAWARAESALIAKDAVAAAGVTPESAWQHVSGLRGLSPPVLAVGIALASWRHRVAIELDRPLGHVLSDRVLIDLARQRPGAPGAVRAFKGISPLARTRADQIIEAIRGADPDGAPAHPPVRAPSARAQRWSELMYAIVQVIADRTNVPPRLLATRADTEEFARVVDERGLEAAEALPARASWRREVIGTVWIEWLTGAVMLVGDLTSPQGLRLVAR